MLAVVLHLRGKARVLARRIVGALDLEDERHQGLGDEAAAEQAEVTALVGTRAIGVGLRHARSSFAARRETPAGAVFYPQTGGGFKWGPNTVGACHSCGIKR